MFYPKLNLLLNTTSRNAHLLEAKFKYSQVPAEVQECCIICFSTEQFQGGNNLSPLLSNIALHHAITEIKKF
jgi:hypothetical protein